MFFFLACFTLYNRLQFHPSHQNWFKCIVFNGWVMLHCVYVPQLSYPFIYWWTSRLLPCPGYYKQCCSEHWGPCVSFNSGFLGVYAQQGGFSRFLIIFTTIILNSFSGGLPISSSFIWTSVFLVCCFICVVFSAFSLFIYLFLTYCVWGLLFPGFKVEFFLPFGFCPPKIGPVVCMCVSFL